MMLLSWMLDLLMPPKCVFCRSLLAKNEYEVCASCRSQLEFDTGKTEPREGDAYDFCVSALFYADDVRAAVLRFKFEGFKSYAPAFARMMEQALTAAGAQGADLITYMPTNRSNIRRRGYNHARLLARALGVRMGRPVAPLLKKARDTVPMFGLDDAQRHANIKGAIVCADPHAAKDKAILLVDDIITTGASMSECAQILKQAGAKSVFGATFVNAR